MNLGQGSDLAVHPPLVACALACWCAPRAVHHMPRVLCPGVVPMWWGGGDWHEVGNCAQTPAGKCFGSTCSCCLACRLLLGACGIAVCSLLGLLLLISARWCSLLWT